VTLRARLWLAAYRVAWRLLLPPVSGLGRIDAAFRERTGKGILKPDWRVSERMAGATLRGRSGGRSALWLHCASLGEAKGLWAFASSLQGAGDILLTAATREGAEFLERRCAAAGEECPDGQLRLRAAIAPFDHPAVVRRFLAYHRIRGLCLYEVELWPHYLSGCREAGLPVALVSGRLTRKAMAWYRRFGGAGMRLLNGLSWIQAQSALDLERFRSLTSAETVAGFDFKAAHYLRGRKDRRSRRDGGGKHRDDHRDWKDGRSGFAFVSLHAAELELLLPAMPGLMRGSRVLVFPRRMAEVARFRDMLEPLGFACRSRSPDARHLLVDAMGMVEALLPGCHSAFVGGSLIPVGCHNLWEPLLAGTKIFFGPFRRNQEALARLLLERGIGEEVRDAPALGTCAGPGPEHAADCERLIDELRQGLDAALADGARRIFATFYADTNVRTATAA
jgi:3-deoxy-D-manno-octulosonic-acid transferase